MILGLLDVSELDRSLSARLWWRRQD